MTATASTVGGEKPTTGRLGEPAGRRPAKAGRGTWVTAAAILCGALAVLLACVDDLLPLPDETAIALWSVLIALLAVAAMGAASLAAGRADWGMGACRLSSWYLAWVAVAFGLTSITWRGYQSGLPGVIDKHSVVTALGLAALSIPAWLAGYLAGPPKPVSWGGDALARVAAPELGAGFTVRAWVPWFLSGVAVAARMSRISSGNYGYLGDPSAIVTSSSATAQLISMADSCGSFAVIVATIALVRQPTLSRRVTLAVLLVVELSFGLISGMKQSVLLAVLGPVVVVTVARRFPLRWVLVAALGFLTVVMPYNVVYREDVRTSSAFLPAADGAGVAVSVLRTTLVGGDHQAGVVQSASRLTLRIREIGGLAVVVQRTPSTIPYRRPVELLAGPVIGVVPRAVWPGKPVLNSGYLFNQEYWGHSDDVYSSAAITPQADFYRHGGLPILLIGMAVLGAGMRLVDDRFHPLRDLRLTVLFVPLLPLLVKSESDVISLVAAIPAALLPAVAVARLAFRPPSAGKGAGRLGWAHRSRRG